MPMCHVKEVICSDEPIENFHLQFPPADYKCPLGLSFGFTAHKSSVCFSLINLSAAAGNCFQQKGYTTFPEPYVWLQN